MRPDATVSVDASFCSGSRSGAYAVWISHDGGKHRKAARFKKRPRNSTQAETWAILNGIAIAQHMGFRNIIVNADCKPAMRNAGCSVPEGMTVDFRHVKAHAGVGRPRKYVNNWCDHQARDEMRKWRTEIEANEKFP